MAIFLPALFFRFRVFFLSLKQYKGDLNNRRQRGSEYRTFEYWKHLNTSFLEVPISTSQSSSFLCTRPTILILDKNTRKKMAPICPVFKWSGCPGFRWHSNAGPFGIRERLSWGFILFLSLNLF